MVKKKTFYSQLGWASEVINHIFFFVRVFVSKSQCYVESSETMRK